LAAHFFGKKEPPHFETRVDQHLEGVEGKEGSLGKKSWGGRRGVPHTKKGFNAVVGKRKGRAMHRQRKGGRTG